MELIQELVNKLGVKEGQAKGGAGLILKQAKERLDSGEFSKVAQAVPDADGLIDDAPKTGAAMGGVGDLASKFGGESGGLGDIAEIAGGFSKLGLDSDMVGKFLPIVLSFVQDEGGDGARNVLEKALKPDNR